MLCWKTAVLWVINSVHSFTLCILLSILSAWTSLLSSWNCVLQVRMRLLPERKNCSVANALLSHPHPESYHFPGSFYTCLFLYFMHWIFFFCASNSATSFTSVGERVRLAYLPQLSLNSSSQLLERSANLRVKFIWPNSGVQFGIRWRVTIEMPTSFCSNIKGT